jgi:4-hydroxybenzoate polyprenyltransferase/phosphoserine phosphatase
MTKLKSKLLVVDLDGTLLKSDMLYESFWNAFAIRPSTPVQSARHLFTGKAALKSYLASEATIDIASLPYDDEVIKYINDYRANGGNVALVTATHQLLADQVAKHLGIFDEVHGSDNEVNLRGAVKAQFLIDRFGRENFCYIGDASDDLPVWAVSEKAITVNASDAVRQKAEALGNPVEHLDTISRSWGSYFKALRPHQWIKNILIFVPMLAAHELDLGSFLSSCLAIIAFSLIASSVYVVNDLLDLSSDRAHPRKSSRPFASGVIPISHGNQIAILCLLIGFATAALLGSIFLFVIGAYYVTTLAYSLVFKRKIIIDICVLAGLYSMRILAGGAATGIDLSIWLLAFSVFFFLSLASVKRQAELVDLVNRKEIKISGRGYETHDLPIIAMISVASGYISVLVMMLYINSPHVTSLYQTPEMLWGVCCVVLYWLTRTVMLTHRGRMHDDPVIFAATDRISQICFGTMLGLMISGSFL